MIAKSLKLLIFQIAMTIFHQNLPLIICIDTKTIKIMIRPEGKIKSQVRGSRFEDYNTFFSSGVHIFGPSLVYHTKNCKYWKRLNPSKRRSKSKKRINKA